MSTWTNDLPTEPGWYWFRLPETKPRIVHIDRDKSGLLVQMFDDGIPLPISRKYYPGQWCGPIDEPK